MFNTKIDVDRHVKEIFNKLHTDNERDAKCYMLAKLYAKVKDYDSAIKYVNRYIINVRNSAQAQRFLGECYEAIKQPSKALDAYKTSLELDGGQRDLVLKVCELLSDPELPLVSSVTSYWLDRLQGLFPKHPTVFKLRERLVRANPELKKDPRELESEIMARPNAPEVRIRFFDFLLESNKVNTAIEQASELVPMDLFPDHLPWFECLNRVHQAFEKDNKNELTMDYLITKITVLERCSYLTLQDCGPEKRSNVECALAVFCFDQGLHSISKFKAKPSDKIFFDNVLCHFRAQLANHMAVLVLRRAKSEPGTWSRATRIASPLLAIATKQVDVINRQETKLMAQWRIQGAERVSVSTHVLQAWADGNTRFLEEVYKSCGGKWRERTYEKIYHNKEYQDASSTSDFINNSSFLDLPTSLPCAADLVYIDDEAQLAHPHSLHHIVWLGLANSISLDHIKPSFRCQLFPNLQQSVNNIENSSPETLNKLDVDSFLYAAVFCAKKTNESSPNGERPKLLPVGIAEQLCSLHQAEWWQLVNKFCAKSTTPISCDQRLRLRKGIEAVRVVGAHGLHPKLLYLLAQQFVKRSEEVDDIEMQEILGERAELLWKAAITLLERLIKRQPVREVTSKLFDYGTTDWAYQDVEMAIEEGKTFLAVRLVDAGQNEEALDVLLELKSPNALYYQALIYKNLAEECIKISKGGLSGDQKSEIVRMLRKSQAVLQEAENSSRKLGITHVHNLNQMIETLSIDVENLIDKMTCESDGPRHPKTNPRLESVIRETLATHSTPKLVRSPTTVENLNQSLNHSNSTCNAPINSSVTDELKLLRSDIGDVKSLLQEFLAEFKKISYKLIERQEMEDILNAEEFAAEEGYDETTQTYYNIPEQNLPRPVQPIMPQFPTAFGALPQYMTGAMWPGSLPFSEGQQLPDFRALQNQPTPMGITMPALPSAPAHSIVSSPAVDLSSKIAPNVVVTSSVTLPTYNRTPQPPMAVTIPPEHVRGGNKPQDQHSNSHAFQIAVTDDKPTPLTVQSPSDQYQARVYEQSPQSFQSTLPKTPTSEKIGLLPTPNQNILKDLQNKVFEADAELCSNSKATPNWTPGKLAIVSDEKKIPNKIVMRGNDGKSLIDVQLNENLVLTRQSDIILSWSVPGFGYGDSMIQKYVVRFKTYIAAKDFESVFNQRKALLASSEKLKGTPNVSTTPQSKTVISPAAFSFTPKTPAASVGILTTPVIDKKNDGLASTEKTVFGNDVSPAFNFTSLAKAGQVSNAFATNTEFKGFAGAGQPLFSSLAEKKQNTSADHDTSGDEDKEYEPNVEFAPVIPLPDLVEVKTGEEDEVKLYDERAKILKFDSETKEWKEKGRGNVKLLQHPETGKVRILMRRDQVHKVCCNHYLDENMKFEKMTSSNRAATWSAQDFASGEISPELLAIQFNKPEILIEFLEKIQNLQQQLRDNANKPKTDKPKVETSSTAKPLSELFKKTPGSWECDLCLVLNKPDVKKCIACETLRPGAVDDGPVADSTSQPVSKFSFGIPPANTAATTTPAKSTFTFGTPSNAPTAEVKSSPFSFGGTPVNTFSFGTPSKQPFTFGTTTPVNGESPGFHLGSSDRFNFKFNKPIKESEPKSPEEEDDDKSDEDDVEHEDENLTFKPVIPLPDKVPVQTGEENEDVVYSHRAKLYRFHDQEWRERGLGDFKILKHKETKKVRLLMRREQVFKICLNHYLLKEMQFTPKDGKSWLWSAMDFAEETVSQELFCLKFRDEEIAQQFKKAIDKELATLVVSPRPAESTDSERTNRAGSAARTLFKDNEVEQVYEYVASAEEQAEAKRLQLPPNFYRYKEAEPCSGCIGCEDDESTDGKKETEKTPPSAAKTTPPKSSTHKEVKATTPTTPLTILPKPSTVLNKQPVVAEPSPATEEKPKSSVFANFSFKSAMESPVTTAAPTSFFGSASGSIFGGNSFSQKPLFGGSALTNTTSIFGGAKNLDDPVKTVFNADSNLSFATLSQNQTAFGGASSAAKTWDTTVKPIFSEPRQKNEDESDNEGTEDDADDSYDPQYKPIIDLPDAIEVRTGEEDEQKLFCQRAKLYRFDSASKQWKERGIGEMKILFNPEHGTYRILMRREQVHNIICNMRISPGLQLLPMEKAANTWMWYGVNFLDGVSENEQLSIKFKTEESFTSFKNVIDGCVEALADASCHEDYEGEGSEYGDESGQELICVKQNITLKKLNTETNALEDVAVNNTITVFLVEDGLRNLIIDDKDITVWDVHVDPEKSEIVKESDTRISLLVSEDTTDKFVIDLPTAEDCDEFYSSLVASIEFS